MRTLSFTLVAVAAMSEAPVAQEDDSGLYLGASLGVGSSAELCGSDDVYQSDCIDTASGGKVYAGYAFGRTVAAELGLRRNGEVSSTSVHPLIPDLRIQDTFENEGTMLSAVVYARPQSNLRPFARLGFHRFRTLRDTADATASTFGQDGGSIFYGLGLRYGSEADDVSFRAEWEVFPLPYEDWPEDELSLLSVGVVYRF